MNYSPKPNPLKNLLTQRKFWMAFLGIIAATIMLATGQIAPRPGSEKTALPDYQRELGYYQLF